MAIKLTDKPDTMAPDSDYPYGDIRDRNGLTPGTPVSREVYADFHQFFERLMDKAGVTHNGLPDNAANGFQLMNALESWYLKKFESYNYTFTDFFNESSYVTGFKYVYPVTSQGLTEISGVNDNSTYDLASLSRNVPIGHTHKIKIKNDLNGTFNFRILLNATGLVTDPPIIKTGVATSDTAYVYNINEIITFVRTEDGWQIIEES